MERFYSKKSPGTLRIDVENGEKVFVFGKNESKTCIFCDKPLEVAYVCEICMKPYCLGCVGKYCRHVDECEFIRARVMQIE